MNIREITEARSVGSKRRPSELLLSAVKNWVTTTHSDRDGKMAALLKTREEAARFLAPSYGTLYRGQAIEAEQWEELKRTGRTVVPISPMASWTKSRQIGTNFAEGCTAESDGYCVLLGIPGSRLQPFIDMLYVAKCFTDEEVRTAYDQDDYWLHDMIREKEVIVEHNEPLEILRSDVKAVY